MSVKWCLGLLAFWVPILAIAWFYKGQYRPAQMDVEKINELRAQNKIEGRQRCIEAVRQMMPSLPKETQERAGELLAMCASDK
jgi:hypothetical protein